MGLSGFGCAVVLALVRSAIVYEGAAAVCNGVGATLGAAFCGGSTLGAAFWGEGVAGFCVGWASGCTISDCIVSCVRSTGAGGFIGGTTVWYGRLLWAVAGSPVFKGISKVFECA